MWNCTAHYCWVSVACWRQLVRPIGQPHQTAAWATVLSSCPWRGWCVLTISRYLHWIGWVTHHPLVGWQWGHPLGCATMNTALTACHWVCLPYLEAHGLLWLVGLTQSLHDCMHIPHAPCGSDFFHDLNHLLEEQISHGAEIEPLCLSQAGLTEWTGQLPSLWQWGVL